MLSGYSKIPLSGFFQVEVVCEEDLKDCLVPKTMIQPLVEKCNPARDPADGSVRKDLDHHSEAGRKLCVMVKDEGIGQQRTAETVLSRERPWQKTRRENTSVWRMSVTVSTTCTERDWKWRYKAHKEKERQSF